MPRPRPVTAAKFVRQLEADPAYAAGRRAQDADARDVERVTAADEASLLAELRAAGVQAGSVYDFVSAGGAPPAAVPVLVAHLGRPHHPRIREGIVRALTVPHARGRALGPLVAAYHAEADPLQRWTLANALAVLAPFSEVQDLPGITEYRPLFAQP